MEKDSDLKLFDLQGILIRNFEIKNTSQITIEKGFLPKGIYILNGTVGGSPFSEKIAILD